MFSFYDSLKTGFIVHSVECVGYEQVRPNQQMSKIAANAYGGYESILMLLCEELHLPLQPFLPHEVKKAAVGFVQAEKGDMEAAVFKRWGVIVSTHDEADSLWVCELVRRKVLGI
jgi:Holliday junction resolvasome RuvABC endonuclease subunit